MTSGKGAEIMFKIMTAIFEVIGAMFACCAVLSFTYNRYDLGALSLVMSLGIGFYSVIRAQSRLRRCEG